MRATSKDEEYRLPPNLVKDEMWSTGKHVVVRLLTIFGVVFGILFAWVYTHYGWIAIIALLAGSTLSILGFFTGVWERLNKPLTERLQYLNQHAFSSLADWCRIVGDMKLNPDLGKISDASAALQSHERYLTTGLYPKKLLSLTEQLDKNAHEYELLWYGIWGALEKWIQNHLNQWATYSTSPDMRALNMVLGIDLAYPTVTPEEYRKLVEEFCASYKRENPGKLDRYVTLSNGFAEQRKDIGKILSAYMRANMLHGQP